MIMDINDFDITRTDKDGSPWVKILVYIRNNMTGEVRKHDDEVWWDGDYPSDYMWSEGNYSCDCNRYLFFQRAKGESEDNVPHCGENMYSVNIVNPKNGASLYCDGYFV